MGLRFTLFLVSAALVLAGLWLLLKPEPMATPEPVSVPRTFYISLVGGAVDGAELMSVYRGDTVRIEVSSDKADALHLHGYDMHLELPPGDTAVLELLANRTGRFELESHYSHLRIAVLEVHPR